MSDPILDLAVARRSVQRWLGAMIGVSAVMPIVFITYEQALMRQSRAIAHALFIPLFFVAAACVVRFRALWLRLACWFGGLLSAWTVYIAMGDRLAFWLAPSHGRRYGESGLGLDMFLIASVFLAIAFVPVNAAAARTHESRLSTLWSSIAVIAWTSLAWGLACTLIAATSPHRVYMMIPLSSLVLALGGFARLHLERVRTRRFIQALRDDVHSTCALAEAFDERAGARNTHAVLDMSGGNFHSPRIAVVRVLKGPHAYRSQTRETVARVLLFEEKG